MVFTKLLSSQIVTHWEQIKYAYASANSLLDSPKLVTYNKNLLLNLLAGKHYCWFHISDDRSQVISVLISSIRTDIKGEKILFFDAYYAYKHSSIDAKILFNDQMVKFARELGCESIHFVSQNPAILKIAEGLKYIEPYKIFEYRIGG
jgi:hypothetical protein